MKVKPQFQVLPDGVSPISDLIPIQHPRLRNTMLVQHMSSKVVCPLDSMSSDTHTPFNWTIHTVIEVHGTVVPVESLLRLKGSRPRAVWGLTGKSAWRTSMRATAGVMKYMLAWYNV